MFRKYQLSFRVLEDYNIDSWIEAYGDYAGDFGRNNIQFGYDICDADYRVIAVHLE